MRALILLESLVVLALAGAILLTGPAPAAPGGGEVFPALRFLFDAAPNELAVYRADDGTSLEYAVGTVSQEGKHGPLFSMSRTFHDASGAVPEGGNVSYVHALVDHGFWPLMAPEVPGDLDRVWVMKRIVREELPFRNRMVKCWRVEFVDPALPADADVVVAWYHETAPVFGILQWQRGSRKYVLEGPWKP